MRAPSELPSTCTRSSPSASSVCSTASVIAATVGRCSRCGDRPMPGRSTLMTSKRSVSAGRTAVKSRREVPRPCSSRSGSPEPVRVRDSGAVTRWESSIVLLYVCCVGVLGSRQGCAPFEGWRIVFRFRCKQRFASHVRSSGRHEHRSPVQLAAGLPALSRCAIPQEMVTTEKVANSHSIIRPSGGCGAQVATSDWARSRGGPARCLVCVRRTLGGATCGEARRARGLTSPAV